MAVTRRVHHIHLADSPFDEPWPRGKAPEFQDKLNKALNSSERIVHMAQQEDRSSKWIVITEELVMGPSNGTQTKPV